VKKVKKRKPKFKNHAGTKKYDETKMMSNSMLKTT